LDFLRKRILTSVIVFLAALNLDFILPRLVPGNAAVIFASGHILPQETVKLIEHRFGLDQPVYVQYIIFLKGIFASWPPFFGFSFQYYPKTVTDLIAQRAPWTILLITMAFFLAFGLSYLLAAYTSIKRGGKFEFSSLYSALIFWSIPAFWFGMVMLWIFATTLRWLPIAGAVGFNPGTGFQYVLSVITHAILPVVTLTLVIFGQNYIILRGAAQEILGSDYIQAAQARGIRERTISFNYVMKNSILPIISLLGYSVATLISAVFFIEYVFSYNGVGDLVVDAIQSRDYPIVEGVFFYVTLAVIILALVGDFLLVRLDPRLRR